MRKPSHQYAVMYLRRSLWLLVAAGVLLVGCDPAVPADGIAPTVTPPAAAERSATASATPTASTVATSVASIAAPLAPGTPASLPTGQASAIETWRVTNIVDGDTVDVLSSSGVEERIRVVGIDTPERGQCGFQEAADALARLVDGQTVTLVAGARDDRDRYGRLLRYLDVGTVDAGLELIRAGLAIARYDSRDGYGRHAREDEYVAADLASLSVCDTPAPTTTFAPPVTSTSTGTVQVFSNCAELNAVYPGGVARVGVTGNMVSGTLRAFGITPHFEDALYAANIDRDGDKDGIACEK